MLKLEDFIAETLPSIVRGIHEGRKDPISGEEVVPLIQGPDRNAAGVFHFKGNDSRQAVMVDFEVSVIAKEANETEKKAGLKAKLYVAEAGVGGKGKHTSETSSVHKLKFSLALGIPTHEPNT